MREYILITTALLMIFYVVNHIVRFIIKKNYCAKCGALILTIIIGIIYKFPIEIIALLSGSLITILTYYTDDWLMNSEKPIEIGNYIITKRKVNIIAQDFLILLVFIFFTMLLFLLRS